MFERIKHMLVKEFYHVFRDPRMRLVLFVAPILELFLFGYAVSTDVHNIRLAVLDRDASIASRELVSRFRDSGYFDIVGYLDDEGEAEEWIDYGDALAVLQFDAGYSSDLDAGKTATVQLLLDGTDSNTASIAGSYAAQIAEDYSRQILLNRLTRTVGRLQSPAGVSLETRAWFNENLISRNYYVPGVIVALVAIISLMLTSMAVVREKEIGTIEQIIATPIRQIEFIVGKTVPFAIISFFDVGLITGVALLWFEVPLRGSALVLLLGVALYLMSTLGMGLFISTVSSTQQQAMMTTFFFMIPAMMLSGFIFPIANMPPVIQYVTYFNPLRYMVIIVRTVFLKGAGLSILWPEMLALFALGASLLGLATWRFQKRMG